MVENIEHLGSKLKFQGLVEGEIAMYREVPLGQPEASQSVSREISLPYGVAARIGRRSGKRRWIQSFVAWAALSGLEKSQGLKCRCAIGSIKIKGLSRDDVRSNLHGKQIELGERRL